MSQSPTLQIPQDVIQPIIDAHVTAEIAKALGAGTVVRTAVENILQTRVDSEGKIDTYHNRQNTRPWIDWAVADALKKRVQSIIIETIEKQSDTIRDQVAAQLRMKNSPLVKQIAEGVAKVALSPDRLKYSIEVKADIR
jgi:hypothetical protein